jgi:superfamily II DNA or RNA helicase
MLRPYQERAITRAREAARTHRSVCLVMPTGAGKTRTCAAICSSAIARGRRVLWLAHRSELVEQAAETLAGLGLEVGVVSASASGDARPDAPCQVASVQTLYAREQRPPADLVIFDEAHHAIAATYSAILRDYPRATVLGPTATPERSDGKGLGDLFGAMVVGTTVRELVELGHLVPAEIIRPAKALGSRELAATPLEAYQRHARGRRAIVFAPSVTLAETWAREFADVGIASACVTGTTPPDERRTIMRRVRAGEVSALFNVFVATEGFDAPAIDCVILARGFGCVSTYLQCVGRALRPAEGKESALIIDLTGVSHAHGHPADDRQWQLEGWALAKATPADAVRYCRVCGAILAAGMACGDCGYEPEPLPPPRVVKAPLERYAQKRAESEDERIATLSRWTREARSKGYSQGWALAKFRAVYGVWPTAKVRALGLR